MLGERPRSGGDQPSRVPRVPRQGAPKDRFELSTSPYRVAEDSRQGKIRDRRSTQKGCLAARRLGGYHPRFSLSGRINPWRSRPIIGTYIMPKMTRREHRFLGLRPTKNCHNYPERCYYSGFMPAGTYKELELWHVSHFYFFYSPQLC